MHFDPNPLYYYMCDLWTNHRKHDEVLKIYNQGGTRSAKTWDTIHFLVNICDHNRGKGLEIYVIRDTLTNCKDYTLKEFKKCFKVIGISPRITHANTKPYINLWGNHIYFRGLPEDGDEAYPSDIIYFNEMLEMPEAPVEDLEMRCQGVVIGDYNPKYTAHWAYGKQGQSNVFFTKTTYENNKHLPKSNRNKIKSYEPWKPGSYEVVGNDIMFEGEIIDDNNQPPPHPINTKSLNGGNPTVDLFRWKVYGLGLRGARKGLIHPYHVAIDKFPDIDHIHSNDFGFTNDPNALVKFAQQDKNIYLELLCYTPIPTSRELCDYLDKLEIPKLKPLICDSSDKFISQDYGVQNMVKGLRDRGYSASKVSKTKNVAFWIGEMNDYTIHIVVNDFYIFAKTEAENYMWKEIHGIELNTPQDGNDHFWNASRYGFMSWNQKTKIWG